MYGFTWYNKTSKLFTPAQPSHGFRLGKVNRLLSERR